MQVNHNIILKRFFKKHEDITQEQLNNHLEAEKVQDNRFYDDLESRICGELLRINSIQQNNKRNET